MASDKKELTSKIELELISKISGKRDTYQKQFEDINNRKGFSDQQAKAVKSLFIEIDNLGDVSKLSGKSLELYAEKLAQINKLLKAGSVRGSQNEAFKKAQADVDKANERLKTSQESRRTTLSRKSDARDTLAGIIKNSGLAIKDSKTNRQLTNIDTIVERSLKGGVNFASVKKGGIVDEGKKQEVLDAIKVYSDLKTKAEEAYKEVSENTEALKRATEVLSSIEKTDKTITSIDREVSSDSIEKNIAEYKDAKVQIKEDLSKRESGEAVAKPEVKIDKPQITGLGRAIKQFSIFATVIRTLKSAALEAKKTIEELDKSITDQAMVTGKTRKEVYNLLRQYQVLAKELGSTSKEVAGVATEYLRQGKTVSESLELTQAAISAAKVASISASDSINYLTTALNGFQLASDQAMKVSDKFAAIAATSATNYEELAVALSKVASQANLAGMSIDYTTALLAKGIETTREAPETIGTALKTVIARMREMTDYGATLEGDTDVNNVETQLAYVGIALKDANGELRSTQDVLDDLGKKWDTLNSNQQASIAKALAGTRQQSRLIAMMSDYERVTELQQVAERSNGATMAQMEKYSDSLEAAINRVTASWEKFITSITNSDFIIGFVNQLAKAVENLSTPLGKILSLSSLALVGGSKLATNINNKAMARAQEVVNRKDDLKKAQTEFDSQKDNKDKARKEYDDLINNKATEKTNEDIKQTSEYKEQQENILELQKTQNELETINIKIKEIEVEQLEKGNALEEERNALIEKQTALIEVKNAQLERQKAIESGDETKIAEAKKADSVARGKLTRATKKAASASEKANSYKTDARKLEILEKKQAQATEKINQIKQKEIDIDKKVVAKRKELINKNKILVAGDADALEAKQKLTDATDSYLIAQDQLKVVQDQMNKLNIVSNAITAAKNILIGIANAINAFALVTTKAQNKIIQKNTELKAANNLQTEIGAATAGVATGTNLTLAASFKAVGVAIKSIPILGWILAAVSAIATVTLLCWQLGAFDSAASKTADKVNKLSAEIYDLNKKATSLDTVIDNFGKLDGKILKTSKDLEEMKSILEEAGNSLSSEITDKKKFGGVSEQDWYNSLSSDKAKLEYLKKATDEARLEANQKRNEQLAAINNLKGSELDAFMMGADAKYVQARDAIYAINNNNIYEQIDTLKELNQYSSDQLKVTEEITSAILEQVDAYEAKDLANNPNRVKELINTINGLTTSINGETIAYAEMLNSSDYSLAQQVEAYRKLDTALSGFGKEYKAFSSLYSQYAVFSNMSEDVLNFIDNANISIDSLNSIYTGYEKLQKAGLNITKEQYQSRFQSFLEAITKFDGDASAAIEETFGDILNQFDKGSKEYINAWNAFVNLYGNAVTKGILNMGQDMDKFTNKVSDFYAKASSWATMSQTDRSQFVSDNYDIFSGADGDKLLKAFESGNYEMIETALRTNETLAKNRQELLDQVEQELKVELSREGDAYNAAYVQQLKEYKKSLENTEKIYQASLEVRLEQQQKAIDQYKDMLQQEQDALTDSLDKRKDAYEKYFNAVNEEKEDEDYEEQAELYQTNLNKLASSTDASSIKQMNDLQNKLEDLEKERLDTLRERAQEALTANIDDQVSDINTKFDELLNNQQALLAALQGDANSSNASLLANLISNQVSSEGLTAVGLESFLQTLQSSLGNYMTGINWDDFSTTTNENNNLVLNIAGKEIVLNSDDQQAMYDAIKRALEQLGLK